MFGAAIQVLWRMADIQLRVGTPPPVAYGDRGRRSLAMSRIDLPNMSVVATSLRLIHFHRLRYQHLRVANTCGQGQGHS